MLVFRNIAKIAVFALIMLNWEKLDIFTGARKAILKTTLLIIFWL